MSKPRYDWWGYVKAIIRRYPRMEGKELSGVAEKEYRAVKQAIEQTKYTNNAAERLELIDLVFWKQTNTLQGAAMQIPCSERTARQWHGDFIRSVARNFGLLD